jgi:hypothetical protein
MIKNKFILGAGKGASGLLGIAMFAVSIFLYGATIFISVWFFLTVVHHFHHSKTSVSTTKATSAPYVATADNFQIDFPAIPTISSVGPSSDSTGGTTTGRVYDLQRQSTDTEYDVVVDNYSDENLDTLVGSSLQSSLQTSANQLAQGAKDSLNNTSFVTFKGKSAIEGVLTPSDATTLSQYFVLFYNGHNVYAITVATTDKSTFQNFANSFSFINK